MGGTSSVLSSAGSPRSYSERANLGKKLPDEILKIFFTRADFKDLLSLASLDKCPSYLFTTAEALKTLFQQFDVEPTLVPGGKIYFAPLKPLSPGLFPVSEQNQKFREAKQKRDTLCMEIAYYYVRIFQIYAALSLTVMEADPSRRPQFLRQQQKAVTSPAFFGGGLAVSRKGSEYYNAALTLLKSDFAPLEDYFEWSKVDRNKYYMKFIDKTRESIGKFYIEWDPLLPKPTRLKSLYVIGNSQTLEEDVVIEKSGDNKTSLRFASDKNSILDFKLQAGIFGAKNKWVLDIDNDESESTVLKETAVFIEEFFKRRVSEAPGRVSGSSSSSSGSSGSSSGLVSSTSSGKSSFTGYDSVKELFDKRFKGEEFPKAYCIARAMTLLMPIFDSEKGNPGQPSYSQVCRKTFDFETTEHMPRGGRIPQANIYLKSLVSLFYDDYTLAEGKVTFIQTETGRSDLRNASKQLAYLYNITISPETFIESQTRFKEFGICENQDVLLQINDKKLKDALITQCITPMIAFQEKHTKDVNALLSQMFIVKDGDLRFTPALRNGGKSGVNAFGKRAASLLLQYYLKSEAYFIRGILLIEENKAMISKV
jgi:hypothetical protein